MSATVDSIRIFIGSSSEGREVARNLEAELGGTCEVVRWDRDVFEPSGYALDSLIRTAGIVDFAVLVATPDDTTESRGKTAASVRDNIVLEFGLFAGALGRERTYLLATGELKLPTDVLGLTRLTYRPQATGNLRAAVTPAALDVERMIRDLGPLSRGAGGTSSHDQQRVALETEIGRLRANAKSQGWIVKENDTTLRLRPPGGRVHTLTKARAAATREELRSFTKELRAAGLRVNSSIRRPVEDSDL